MINDESDDEVGAEEETSAGWAEHIAKPIQDLFDAIAGVDDAMAGIDNPHDALKVLVGGITEAEAQLNEALGHIRGLAVGKKPSPAAVAAALKFVEHVDRRRGRL